MGTSNDDHSMSLIIEMLRTQNAQAENLRQNVSDLKDTVMELKLEVNDLKNMELLQRGPAELKRLRVRDYSAGTAIGSVIMGLILAAYEFFAKKF